MTAIMLFLFIGWAAIPAAVSAEAPSLQTSFSERAVLQAGQVVQGDYFAAGPRVEISGIVNGDLYVAGGQVLVDGVVNGDVIVAGGKVTLSGTVAQDARIAGGAGSGQRNDRQKRGLGRRRCPAHSDSPSR